MEVVEFQLDRVVGYKAKDYRHSAAVGTVNFLSCCGYL